MQCHRLLRRRHEARPDPGPARQGHRGRAAAGDRQRRRRPRAQEPARGRQPRPGDRPRRRLQPRRGRRHQRRGSCAWPEGPHGRGALRERRRPARLHAGPDQLAGRRRHPVLRRDQERRAVRRCDRRVRAGCRRSAGLSPAPRRARLVQDALRVGAADCLREGRALAAARAAGQRDSGAHRLGHRVAARRRPARAGQGRRTVPSRCPPRRWMACTTTASVSIARGPALGRFVCRWDTLEAEADALVAAIARLGHGAPPGHERQATRTT